MSIECHDAHGRSLWQKTLGGSIRLAHIGQLFREKTTYVVVLSDERNDAALVSIYDNAGNLFASYDHKGPLRHMEVQRPTGSHNPRIVLAGMRRNIATQLGLTGPVPTVLQLWPRNTGGVSEDWCTPIGRPRETITKLQIASEGKKREIVVTTSAGNTVRLDFKGNVL